MSRIGKQPIPLPSGVSVTWEADQVKVKGPKGELSLRLQPGIALVEEDSILALKLERTDRAGSAMYGLSRALLANMVKGVSEGFSRTLEIQGTGYRANMKGETLELLLGFSHLIEFAVPKGIEIAVETPTRVVVKGIDKQQVGQVAADIRGFRPPEPYKGKGVRYEGEHVRRKAGKSASASG
jgi:large subunit ribosomal protein L6